MTTVEEQRLVIQDKAPSLLYDDKMHILQILKYHGPPVKVCESADGSRINLDELPEGLINKIYHIIIAKLEVPTDNLIQ